MSLLGGPGAARLPALSHPDTTPPNTGPVTASQVAVSSPDGDPDDSPTAPNVIEGDPASSWSTDVYRNQFPTFKPRPWARAAATPASIRSCRMSRSSSANAAIIVKKNLPSPVGL